MNPRVKTTLSTVCIFFLFAAGYAASFKKVQHYRKKKNHTEEVLYITSPKMLNLLSLNFKNLVSELIFIRALIYFGDRIHSRIMPDWKWLYRMADAATFLDPYNIDMYYFTNAILPWDAHMVEETNEILERGLKYRTWDHYIPTFLGFNNFYFLKNDAKAVTYFEKAARINPNLAPMAAKFHLRLHRTDAAIAFLKEIQKGAQNVSLAQSLGGSISFLEKMQKVEEAIKEYESRYNTPLETLEQLIKEGLVKTIPLTPFGAPLVWNKEKRTIDVVKPTASKG